jgi:Pyruvate/2-oxoacid:ferredoxin oxidoreductase gamma subunit
VAFNAPSLARFAPAVAAGGTILYDSTVIPQPPPLPAGRRVLAVPCTAIAGGLGWSAAKNLVALGALQAATGLLPPDCLLATLRQLLKDKPEVLPQNEAAFAAGQRAVVPEPAPS